MKDDSSTHEANRDRTKLRISIVLLIVIWTFLYNVLIKGQSLVTAFLKILDTISDDFVMGTLLTVVVGAAIVLVFAMTKFYTQLISNIHSFRIIEDLAYSDLKQGRVKTFFSKVLRLEDQPIPKECCPTRPSSLLCSFGVIYALSWIYLILFSEALFFISWSAGVDLPINGKNLILLPTLSLAIPFSARVMAYLRYPYAQDYADFMPGAVFVLLIVATLGYLFQSEDQKFFLVQVYNDAQHLRTLLKNGVFLAFIPVFFEGGFWLLEMNRQESETDEPEAATDAE